MGKEVLVEINVPDTDELRLKKINRNFQFLFKQVSSGVSIGSSSSSAINLNAAYGDNFDPQVLGDYMKTDLAFQTFSTEDDIESAVEGLKEDISWVTSSQEFTDAVSDVASDEIEAQLDEGGTIADAIIAAISDSLEEGGDIETAIKAAATELTTAYKRYADDLMSEHIRQYHTPTP